VDLGAKLIRTLSVLRSICKDQDPNTAKFTPQDIHRAKEQLKGQIVISKLDKQTYSVHDLLFDHSAESLPVEGLGMSHAEYYEKRKQHKLQFPNAKPMVAVLGRRKAIIHLPAEIICANELDPSLKEMLPQIASFQPAERSAAIDEIRRFLKPGAQKTKGGGGLLPALGIVLKEDRLVIPAEVLPAPFISSAGVRIPDSKSGNWTPLLSKVS
jgi:hypothetical protein